jgi:hypothetical protein
MLNLNNTYKTNRFKLPFFQITSQICLNSVFNTAFGLIDNKKFEGFDFLIHCHGSSLDLTLGHVTVDIRVEGAILTHSEEATGTLGRNHPSFTRPTLG